jgi:hypothetical protein
MMQIGLIVVVAIVLAACWFGYKHLKAVYERQSLLSSRIVFLESLLQDDEPSNPAKRPEEPKTDDAVDAKGKDKEDKAEKQK